MLPGVRPCPFHQWPLAMYADEIDKFPRPNVLGMGRWGDGRIVGSKPYVVSGNYISRTSEYRRGCPFDPRKGTGKDPAR